MNEGTKTGAFDFLNAKYALNLSRDLYVESMNQNQLALSYWKNSRGFSEEAIRHFGLGYAPNERFFIYNKIGVEQSVNFELLKEIGLLTRNGGDVESPYRDLFNNRVVIPFTEKIDGIEQVVGFSARVIGEAKTAKYINSTTNPIFNKSQFLFNWEEARRSAMQTGELYVYEAPVSVISSWQRGIKSTTALSGTALTNQHAIKIRKSLPNQRIYLCFDSDEAGERAMEKATEEFLDYDFQVIRLPFDKDPDELLRDGSSFQDMTFSRQGGFDFLTERKRKSLEAFDVPLSTLEDKLRLVSVLKEPIRRIQNGRRVFYTSELERNLGIREGSLKYLMSPELDEFSRGRNTQINFVTELLGEGDNGHYAEYYASHGAEEFLTNPLAKQVFKFTLSKPESLKLLQTAKTPMFGEDSENVISNEIYHLSLKESFVLDLDEIRGVVRSASDRYHGGTNRLSQEILDNLFARIVVGYYAFKKIEDFHSRRISLTELVDEVRKRDE